MRYEKPVNVIELLEHSNLAKMMKKGLFLNNLNLHLQQRFPKQYLGLYKVANLEQDTLYLEVANAIIRQALMFQQKNLLALVNTDYPEVKTIKFHINPSLSVSL
ncbi:MAG: DciA family protein [Pasteurella oralis]|uniref:DciA family protein n=1 Tax=Pasteurella oralis TaxID=1071947 RepID=UPI00270A6280|nr:DciA family protein [Pasteurella oralis]